MFDQIEDAKASLLNQIQMLDKVEENGASTREEKLPICKLKGEHTRKCGQEEIKWRQSSRNK